jgi:hypothetical protein
MSIKKYFLVIFLFFLSLTASAGDRKGNGADFVACPDRTSLLDFYENDFIDFPWEGTEIELVHLYLEKMSLYSPIRAKIYLEQANNFYKEVKFVEDSTLGKVDDSGGMKKPLPENCKLYQGIIQKLVVFGSEKRYLIDKKEWGKLPVLHRAGAIVHELIYRELQTENSRKIKNFNEWFFSTKLETIAEDDFYRQMQIIGFPWVYLYNYPMDVQTILLNNGPIRATFTFAEMPFYLFNQKIFSKRHYVDSFSNGHPRAILYKGSIKFENENFQFEVCPRESTSSCRISLDENGKVVMLNNVNLTEKKSGKFFPMRSIRFNENGEVSENI